MPVELKNLTRDAVRELLLVMFEGWRLHEASYVDSEYTKTHLDASVEAAGSDVMLGTLAFLFGHWSNDVIAVAAHYGVGFASDGTVTSDLPAAPTPEHFWYEGEWRPPFDDSDDIGEDIVAGRTEHG